MPKPAYLLPLLLLLTACQGEPPVQRKTFTAYGSPVTITVQGTTAEAAQRSLDEAATDLLYIEDGNNPAIPGPMARTNQLLAATGEFSAVPSLLPQIRQAQALSARSGGLFNPALGGLLELWGFYREPKGPPPAPEAVAALAARRPAMGDITIEGISMRSGNGAVRIDLGDFGRGYALDTALARLREAGVSAASLTTPGAAARIGAGAELMLTFTGADGRTPLAQAALRPDEVAYTVTALRNSYVYEGQLYHPLLDPARGMPARGVFAVTVFHTSLAEAAAAAHALFVAGPARWVDTARALGVERALLVDTADTVRVTGPLAARVSMTNARLTPVVDTL
ncbi:MAG: thiamine biosynthesis protein ApbE [Gammaproteobacteria bacterium HGW-Gammaproteobacteria-1]|jgi:thiamine biosynthesis lipoprotein|nr:MAG: thiamine biosynthesis protein ApbE [Gammaproteobacteria bacterium HGW-Gammaproteobacteria-1]